MEQQLASITVERDKLWKIVEALLAPAVAPERSVSPRAPGALSPPAGGGTCSVARYSAGCGPEAFQAPPSGSARATPSSAPAVSRASTSSGTAVQLNT